MKNQKIVRVAKSNKTNVQVKATRTPRVYKPISKANIRVIRRTVNVAPRTSYKDLYEAEKTANEGLLNSIQNNKDYKVLYEKEKTESLTPRQAFMGGMFAIIATAVVQIVTIIVVSN